MADNQTIIGMDLGGTKMYAALVNTTGEIHSEKYIPWKENDSAGNIGAVISLINDLSQQATMRNLQLKGVGIGAPGITDSQRGIVSWAPALGWDDLHLKDILADRFQVPIFVENDVNLAALGEYDYGAGKGTSSLVLLAIGTGIGSGIVINGELLRGAHFAAGEVGYLAPDRSYLAQDYKGFGALESLASGPGIVRSAHKWLAQFGYDEYEGDMQAESIFAAAREGEKWAQAAVSEAVDYLALAIVAYSALIDPEIIVLSGGVAKSADLLIEPILERVHGVTPFTPKLKTTMLGPKAGVLGAIRLVTQGNH